MLTLALIALLAASTPDAPARIPGTRLSLGMTEIQLQDQGTFPAASVADAAGMIARQGESKFFGVPCQTTFYLRDGRLVRVHFEASTVSPKAVDYIEDQLRREKMFRECARLEPDDHVCDWLGDVKIHLETQKEKLNARVEMPPRPWETETDSVRAEPSKPAPVTSAPTTTTTTVTTTTSAPAPAHTTPAPSAPATATAAPSAPAPSVPLPSVATPAAMPSVPTLPETLRLSLPERNSASEWPRMTTMPKLEYPEAAKKESVQGIVWVLAQVDTDGTVRSATVDRGIRELNDAAIAWVSKARFAPCVREGHPCRFWIRVASRFTLY